MERALKGPFEYRKVLLNIGRGPAHHASFIVESQYPAHIRCIRHGQAVALPGLCHSPVPGLARMRRLPAPARMADLPDGVCGGRRKGVEKGRSETWQLFGRFH